MFDIGFYEILLIFILALLVLGPERLPVFARYAGLFIRRARFMFFQIKDQIDNEIQLKNEDLNVIKGTVNKKTQEFKDDIQQNIKDTFVPVNLDEILKDKTNKVQTSQEKESESAEKTSIEAKTQELKSNKDDSDRLDKIDHNSSNKNSK